MLGSDGAGEFASPEITTLCAQKLALHTPIEIVVAKRARTRTEKVRTLLTSTGLSKHFWPFAFQHAVTHYTETLYPTPTSSSISRPTA